MSDRYQPPFQITSRALNLVAQISELLGRWSVSADVSLAPQLRRGNRLERPKKLKPRCIAATGLRMLLPHMVDETAEQYGYARACQQLNGGWACDPVETREDGLAGQPTRFSVGCSLNLESSSPNLASCLAQSKGPRRIRRGQLPTGHPQSMNAMVGVPRVLVQLMEAYT